MLKPFNLSLVAYNNTLPFQYAFTKADFSPYSVKVTKDVPSACALKLLNGSADIGIVPVAAAFSQPSLQQTSDFCIGADGEVKTVVLFSNQPIDELDRIQLDYQSRTSNMLVKVLCKHHWKRSVTFTQSVAGYETGDEKGTGKIVIGDRVFGLMANYKYVYDLSFEWNKMTGLPFVFAAWFARNNVDPGFLSAFNSKLSEHISVYWESKSFRSLEKYLQVYLRKNISYDYDSRKADALKLFSELASGVI